MTKAELASRLPIRRGLTEAEAAIYVGIGSTLFRQMVADGRYPKPRLQNSARTWDVEELDAAYRSLPREGSNIKNSWDDYRGRDQA